MKLSVHVACYNTASYLEDCIRSLLRCLPEAEEIFITDDASSDGSAEIAAGLATRCPIIRYERNEKNLGIAATRAKMIAGSDAEYIIPFDSDDIMYPGFHLPALQRLEKNPEAAGIYGKVLCFKSSPENAFEPFNTLGWDYSSFFFGSGTPATHSASILRRKNIVACGSYLPPPAPPGCDYYLWTRLIDTGTLLFEDRYSQLYRHHNLQVSTAKKAGYAISDNFARDNALQRHAALLEKLHDDAQAQLTPDQQRSAMFLLGIRCNRLPESDDYFQTLQQACRIRPDDYMALFLMVNALMSRRQPEAALECSNHLRQLPVTLRLKIQFEEQYRNILQAIGRSTTTADEALLRYEEETRREMRNAYRRSLELLAELKQSSNH